MTDLYVLPVGFSKGLTQQYRVLLGRHPLKARVAQSEEAPALARSRISQWFGRCRRGETGLPPSGIVEMPDSFSGKNKETDLYPDLAIVSPKHAFRLPPRYHAERECVANQKA